MGFFCVKKYQTLKKCTHDNPLFFYSVDIVLYHWTQIISQIIQLIILTSPHAHQNGFQHFNLAASQIVKENHILFKPLFYVLNK